jgi:hypothetical protein
MRLFTSALCTTVAIALLAGCASNAGTSNVPVSNSESMARVSHPISVWDDQAPPLAVQALHELVRPTKTEPTSGTYVSEFDAGDVYGYPANNKTNKKPICMVSNVSDVNDVGVDAKGNLMIPDGGAGYLLVQKGPNMCGKSLAEIADSYGQPSDASSPDAATGKIALANLADSGSTPGSLSICTAKGGCTVNLTNGSIYHAGGVAMSNSGDCWLNAKTSSSGGDALIYFKGCKGGGTQAKGTKSTYYGGMDIDNKGNLVIIDDMAEVAYVYSGCNPTCKLLGGPFTLKGETFFGKLNSTNTEFTAVARTDGDVDVYSYSTKAIKYEYSFNKGLTASELPDGVAVNPRSKQ